MECVPNFSEGRDTGIVDAIAAGIGSVEGVRVLDVDRGKAANRTVITFAGDPDSVVEAAFRGVSTAAELIDMRRHTGEHPRIGATDVLPLVPVSGISLEEAARYARRLAQRISDEIGIPTYLYEAAAANPQRRKLEQNRAGEWEGLPAKITTAEGRPDFGPDRMTTVVQRAGATVVGAREFLIAVNFNLDTPSAAMAEEIARDVRESGRLTGGENGEKVRVPGTLRGCKAIGWFIEEYGFAQVSMNITDTSLTPLHIAFEQVKRAAALRGAAVTGTEIIGLVPKAVMVDAGKYFIAAESSQDRCGDTVVSDEAAITKAIRVMNLDQISPFDPRKKIIEYRLNS